jgi:hypothetical protein
MTEVVGSGVGSGSGSISQRYGSGHQNVTDPPTLPVMLHTTGKIKVVPETEIPVHRTMRYDHGPLW